MILLESVDPNCSAKTQTVFFDDVARSPCDITPHAGSGEWCNRNLSKENSKFLIYSIGHASHLAEALIIRRADTCTI